MAQITGQENVFEAIIHQVSPATCSCQFWGLGRLASLSPSECLARQSIETVALPALSSGLKPVLNHGEKVQVLSNSKIPEEMVLDKRNIEPLPIKRDDQIRVTKPIGSFAKGVIVIEIGPSLFLVPDAQDGDAALLSDAIPVSAKLVGSTPDLQVEVKGMGNSWARRGGEANVR